MATSTCPVVFRGVKMLLMTVALVFIACGQIVWADQSFQEEPSDTTVLIGEAVVVLKCVIAEKSGNVLWLKDNEYLASDYLHLDINHNPRYSFVGNTSAGEYNLQIEELALDDDGEFYCMVMPTQNSSGITSRKAKLTVQKIPSAITLVPGDPILTVQAGVKTNLTCRAVSANPAAEIAWARAGQTVAHSHQRVAPAADDPSGKLRSAASVLTLTPALADHSVVYECLVSHMAYAAPKKITTTLDVQHVPVVTVESSHPPPIREDTSVIFRCVVNANPRKVSYTWTKSGESILGAESSQLEIVITKDDNGASIQCTAENTIGSASGSLTVPVLYGPRFIEVPASVSVDMEAPAQMSCSADGNPTPTIKWTRLRSRATLSTMHVLQFDLIRKSDVGTYVCIATVPGFEPVMSYGRVDINSAPEITSPAEFKAKVGHQATLRCFTKSKPDPYMVVWSWDGRELEEGSMGRFATAKYEADGGILSELTIEDVENTDYGYFNCTMINEVGDVSLLVKLVPKELDLIVWIIVAVVGTAAVIFVATIIVMAYCRRKWRRRKKALSADKGKVKLEIVRKLTDDDDFDKKSSTTSCDYNATPPSTPGKPRYAEPYAFTRGRRDSTDGPHYRSPRRPDDYSYDDRYPDQYPDNEYSEPFVRQRQDDKISFHSDGSEDYARRDHGDGRYDDDDDDEVKQYNANDPRYKEDTRYHDDNDDNAGDRRYYDDRSYGDAQSYDNRYYDDEYSYKDDRRRYSTEGSLRESEISQAAKNKLATNV